jgi:hypothetical protein
VVSCMAQSGVAHRDLSKSHWTLNSRHFIFPAISSPETSLFTVFMQNS